MANFSQALLSTLDAILGSTESSRAIAAIITLIRREFRPIEAGADAQKVGVGDLLIGSVGFALLQRWGRKNTERRLRENGGDEVVWDTVILDDGARADVIGTHQVQFAGGNRDAAIDPESASFVMPGNGDGAFDAVHRRSSTADSLSGSRVSLPLDGNEQVSDEEIRSYIMSQLPQGCHASIRSEVLTARTITVDIFDDDMAEISAPPGTTMIEERFHHNHEYANSGVPEYQRLPKHTVVFRTALNRSQNTQLRPTDGLHTPGPIETERSKRALPGTSRSSGQSRNHHHHLNSRNDSESDVTIKQLDLSSPEATSDNDQKPPFGKGSFTKLAQRVKSNGPDRIEHTKRTPRNPVSKSPGSSGSSMTTSRQPIRSNKGTASGKGATAPETSSQVDGRRRLNDTPDHRPTTSAPNREPRRSSYPVSPQSPRSHPKHIPARDVPDRHSSRSGNFAIRERSQESLLTHTDTFSRRTAEFRPGSPATSRTHVRSSSSMSITHSEADGTVSMNDHRPSSSALHRRSRPYTPSMYSVATAGSETSLLLAHRPRKSAYEDMATLQALNRDGFVPGMFPERHFVKNIRRFCRFSSASYGASALKVMGVPRGTTTLPQSTSDSHEHSAFSDHAGLPPSTILLSSFVDPAGGSNAAGETESGFPLVHYLSIDHESKAVVLTLRGTWGFEDILTDMTCDYDDLDWQGKNWKVHKGMHASAKRLLEGGGRRVMITLRAALEEFTDYGVVLCGHSLGGGVAALLATMISEPSNTPIGTSFVTASYHPTRQPPLLTADSSTSQHAHPPPQPPSYDLPAGRPIHVYAYGPPAVMSPFLRLATRGLITTVINGTDVVPSLSLGILHDMHTVSTAFKRDVSGAKSQIRHRLHESLRQSIIHKFYVHHPPLVINAGDGVGEDAWAWKTLELLREEMRAPKLMPPGEVFVVETMRVLQREAFTPAPEFGNAADGYPRLGRPATRVRLRFIGDVGARFGEMRFEGGMLTDHNPARYETSLAALARGVLDE